MYTDPVEHAIPRLICTKLSIFQSDTTYLNQTCNIPLILSTRISSLVNKLTWIVLQKGQNETAKVVISQPLQSAEQLALCLQHRLRLPNVAFILGVELASLEDVDWKGTEGRHHLVKQLILGDSEEKRLSQIKLEVMEEGIGIGRRARVDVVYGLTGFCK